MIQTQHVTAAYNGGKPALEDVSISISKGEFVFLIGPTGTGKSTFLRLINREILPVKGTVFVGARDITKMPEREIPGLRRSMGVVFQDLHLLPERTVRENVAFALQAIGASRLKVIKEVPCVLERVGLLHKAHAYPDDLSGGEKQRVAIARAIVNSPTILLADEPTGNLDPEASWGISQLLQQINLQGTTVLVATHDRSIVNALKKRVVVIENGRIARDIAAGSYGEAIASKIANGNGHSHDDMSPLVTPHTFNNAQL